MRKLLKVVTFLTFAVIALVGYSTVSHATSSLPPGFLVGDDTGFQAGTDGEYFISNNDIYPGQTFSREITLSNYSTEDGSFSVNLVMNPEDEEHVVQSKGNIDLLEAINVKLTYQKSVIYEGPISGNGTPIANKQSAPINLGSLEVGEVRNIQADFTVSDAYATDDWKEVSSIDFYWLFYANRETTTSTTDSSSSTVMSSSLPPTGKLPQTGEDWRNVLLGMIAGFVLITVALVIARKRHNNQ